MKALLDVNVLVALAWETHQFHPAARHWLENHQSKGWATCAITQLGFIRVSGQSAIFGEHAKTPEQARVLMAFYTSHKNHTFFSELPNPSECAEFSKLVGPNKVTDAFLINVARFHNARFVTFDNRLASLASQKSHIEILSPSIHGK